MTGSSGNAPAEPTHYAIAFTALPGRPVAVRIRLLLKAMARLRLRCTRVSCDLPGRPGAPRGPA